MGYVVSQNSTAYPLRFLLVLASDHITGATGLTPTVGICKPGATGFTAPAGAVTELGDGWYQVAGNATDTNTLGPLVLHATGTGTDPTDEVYPVVAYNPQSATNLGLSNLDAAVSSRSTYAGGAVASVTAAVTVGGYSAGQDPATLVLDATASSHNTAGTIGHDINAAGTASDPWTTALPGAYAAGTAGYILGTNVDAKTSSRMATFTLPANFASLAIDASGRVDLGKWLGTAPATPSVAGVPVVDQHYTDGLPDTATAQAGTTSTITLAASASTTISYANQYIAIVGGTGAGQTRLVQSSTVTAGKVVCTVTPSWDVAPDATSVYQMGGFGLVTPNLAETLGTPRALDAVADGSITLNDALWCAVAAAAGKESVTGTTYLIQTPSTGTTIRSFTLDSGSAPTTRS